MNQKSLLVTTAGIVLIAGTLSACQSSTKTAITPTQSSTPANTNLTLPVASNPIVNNSTSKTLVITYSAVENNVDPFTNQAIGDQLELTLKNAGTTPLSGLEVYYEMTDVITKAKEGYYQKLIGLVIPAGQKATVYFDNKKLSGHYPENAFSIYRSSQNEVDFNVWASAPGAKIATSTAVKSKSTGEKPNA